MIADLKPYAEYKESGIPWACSLPATWRTERAKWLFRKMDRPVRPEDEVVTCFRDGMVTLRKNRRLSSFDVEAGKVQLRLELQYEESKDFLATLIQRQVYSGDRSASIHKMQGAYARIKAELESHLKDGVGALTEFAAYFLTKIDLVVIESENLSSALKIFETINQRGAGLNAMDLIKNLLFSKASADAY